MEGVLWGMVGFLNPATWYWMNCKLVSRLRAKSKKKITFLWQKKIEFRNHNWRKVQYFLQKVFLLCASSLRMNYSNWLANKMNGKSDSNFSWFFSITCILEICLLLIWKYNFFKLLSMLSKVKFHLKLNFIRHCQFFF